MSTWKHSNTKLDYRLLYAHLFITFYTFTFYTLCKIMSWSNENWSRETLISWELISRELISWELIIWELISWHRILWPIREEKNHVITLLSLVYSKSNVGGHCRVTCKAQVQRFSKILQHKSKSGSYVLANQNADFKSRFVLVLEHAHESSLWTI